MNRRTWILATSAILVVVGTVLADGPTFLATWGEFGSAPGQFSFPHHLAVTPGGEVYVGDVGNNRVQRFSSTGAFLGQWPLSGADGIAVAPDGSAYVAGGDQIHK